LGFSEPMSKYEPVNPNRNFIHDIAEPKTKKEPKRTESLLRSGDTPKPLERVWSVIKNIIIKYNIMLIALTTLRSNSPT
jgi:hypothetical protein